MHMQFTRDWLREHLVTPRFVLQTFVMLGLFAITSQAHAQNLATCLIGTHAATWSPAATNNPQDVTVSTTSVWSCTTLKLLPLPPSVVTISATSVDQFEAPGFTCNAIAQPVPATWIIKWGDGTSSTVPFTFTVNNVQANLVITGTGTIEAGGKFGGANAVVTFTLPSLSVLTNACATSGVSNVSGLSTLTIAAL